MMQTVQPQEPTPGAWKLFLIWTNIGLQSFGGGASTNLLIQREFVDKHRWVTMEEYAHFWTLCLFAPGINLVALTILIGKKLGGTLGIFVSLLGMLAPSATITCLLAAGFKQVEHIDSIQAVLKGVIPATAGIMLLVEINFARPQLQIASKEGALSIMLSLLLITSCALAIIVLNAPVFIILPCVALLGIVLFTRPLFTRTKEGSRHD